MTSARRLARIGVAIAASIVAPAHAHLVETLKGRKTIYEAP